MLEGELLSPPHDVPHPAVPGQKMAQRPATPATSLTTRETEVAALIAEGLTNRQIGERLVISERTVDNHVQRILNKLGATNRAQIAARISANGSASHRA